MANGDDGKSFVRLVDDERLDIPDTLALQTLVYEYVAQALGSLIGFPSVAVEGQTGGCLTLPVFDTAVNKELVPVRAFTFLAITRSLTNASKHVAEVVRYDPSLPSQAPGAGTSSVNVGAWYTGDDASAPLIWVWAKAFTMDIDSDTRRKWDPVAGKETAFGTATRTRTRVVFATSHTAPPLGGGWTPIARVSEWNNGVPTFVAHSAFDSIDLAKNPGRSTSKEGIDLLGQNNGTLAYILWQMRRSLGRLLNTSGETHWHDIPSAGVNQLHTRVGVLEGRPIDKALNKKPFVHASGVWAYSPLAPGIYLLLAPAELAHAGLSGWQRLDVGVVEVSLLDPIFPDTYPRFHVTPIKESNDTPALAVCSAVEPVSDDPWVVKVRLWKASDGTPLDHSFVLTVINHEA